MRFTLRLTPAVLALVLLAGCSDDGSEPTREPSPSAATTGSTEPSVAASTGSPTPSVEPATGPVIDQVSATVNAPEGWELAPEDIPFSRAAEDSSRPRLQLVDVTDIADSTVLPLRDQVRIAKKNRPGLERLPDVVLDGAPAYHLAVGDRGLGTYDEIGTLAHGRSLAVTFTLNGFTPAERTELIESVIATFRWKD